MKGQGRENTPHIGIFGRCNAGKSTLMNMLTGTQASIVSAAPGTTTDAVRKRVEVLDVGPVIFIDTAGTDDQTEIGQHRSSATGEVMSQVDMAIVVFREWSAPEKVLASELARMKIPYIKLQNLFHGPGTVVDAEDIEPGAIAMDLLALSRKGSEERRNELFTRIRESMPAEATARPTMFGDGIKKGDAVMLVCPIDGEAPAGRMILPQMQAVRELLDRNAIAIVVQPEQVVGALTYGPRPKMVVTDSQAFAQVSALVPPTLELTSFSILLAAAKGDPELYAEGLKKVDSLAPGARILISESCNHQVSCDDIGRVKIPRWLEEYTGKKFEFTILSGLSPLPHDLASYDLMVQCGGCMVTTRQLRTRIRMAAEAGVAVTNYGMLIRKLTCGR